MSTHRSHSLSADIAVYLGEKPDERQTHSQHRIARCSVTVDLRPSQVGQLPQVSDCPGLIAVHAELVGELEYRSTRRGRR